MIRLATWLTAFLLLACSSTDEGEPPRSIAGNRYTNTLNGLALQFPASWTLKTDQKSDGVNLDLLALGPRVDGFSPNVNIILQTHTGSTDWAVILPAVQQEVRAAASEIGDYVEAVKEVNGISYAEIGYSATFNGTRFEFIQLLILNKGRRTTVTFTDLAARFDANVDFPAIKASLALE